MFLFGGGTRGGYRNKTHFKSLRSRLVVVLENNALSHDMPVTKRRLVVRYALGERNGALKSLHRVAGVVSDEA